MNSCLVMRSSGTHKSKQRWSITSNFAGILSGKVLPFTLTCNWKFSSYKLNLSKPVSDNSYQLTKYRPLNQFLHVIQLNPNSQPHQYIYKRPIRCYSHSLLGRKKKFRQSFFFFIIFHFKNSFNSNTILWLKGDRSLKGKMPLSLGSFFLTEILAL